MDEYLIIAVRWHHGLCHQEIYVCKNDPQSQGYKVAHSRPYLWSVLVRGGELFGVNISHWESIQELKKYNALKLAAGQWLIDEMIEQGQDVLNHKIKRDATVEDYQPDIEALNKIVEEYRHAPVQ